MELRQLLLFLSALLLSSCSIFKVIEDTENQRFKAKQDASILGLFSAELLNVKAPKNKPVIAVYPNSFTDQTGQRKSNSEFALFSTALTQAPQALLIRALKHTSKGNFFRHKSAAANFITFRLAEPTYRSPPIFFDLSGIVELTIQNTS